MGVKTMKDRTFFGPICIQRVYNVPDGARNISQYDPEKAKRERFDDEAAYDKFKAEISRRKHYRNFMDNFSPSSLYSTLTFATEWEVHTFDEARIVRRRYIRVLRHAFPDAVIFLYMGRGKATNRIHFHMVSEGVPEDVIQKKWKYGSVVRIEHLREHCYYGGIDHGADYAGLANYLFDHWTEEVGGHRWFQTKNARKPKPEEPTEVKIRGGYSEKRPPQAPKGYKLVEIKKTKYGFYSFKYVLIPPPHIRGSKRKNTGQQTG